MLRGAGFPIRILATTYLFEVFPSYEFNTIVFLIATVTWATYFLGFDLYISVNRRFARLLKEPTKHKLVNGLRHVVFSIYLATFLIASLVSELFGINLGWTIPVLLIMFSEHYSTENFRLLNLQSRQLMASALMFMKHSAFSIPVVALAVVSVDTLTLESVIISWMAVSITVSIFSHFLVGIQFSLNNYAYFVVKNI